MRTLIHKKAQTVSEKLIKNANVKAFSGNDIVALLQKLQGTGEVSGIALKAPSKRPTAKPKTSVGASVEFSDDGKYAMLRLTGADGRDFAFGIRKAKEILANIEAIENFVEEYDKPIVDPQ